MLDLENTLWHIQAKELYRLTAVLVKITDDLKKALMGMSVSHMSLSQKSPYQKTLARLSTGLLAIKKITEVAQAYDEKILSPHSLHLLLIELNKFTVKIIREEKAEYTQSFISMRKLFSELKVKG